MPMVSPAQAPAAPGQRLAAPFPLVALVVALFFIWGGATSLNDILIPKLKGLFALSYTQALLIQFAFFTAYALVSLPAGALVSKLGYGRGIATGLGVMAVGCLLFAPAAAQASYPMFLTALFVLAGGVTTLQVAANPLIATLGPTETSHSRLTFAQAFNALGTTVWPYVGAQLILGSVAETDPATLSGAALAAFQAQEAAVIGHTYLGIAMALAVVAVPFLIWRHRLGEAARATSIEGGLTLLGRPRLAFGVAAIFLYVGAEVTIGSLLVSYLMQADTLALHSRRAGELIALYWGGAMIGRFIGAALLRIVAPGRLLAAVAVGAVALISLSMATQGPVSGYALIAVGLTNAIMFPTIFSLALEGLGERTAQGSGLLCMAIVGGALVPLASGVVADAATLRTALLVPVVCYLAIAAFGWSTRGPAKE